MAVVNDNRTLIYATHGHKLTPKAPFPIPENAVVVYGHTHIPTDKTIDNIRYMNPGSVSIPKNGSERGYLIVENGLFEWKNLDGNKVNPFSE
jgi:putative phosphoesterase